MKLFLVTLALGLVAAEPISGDYHLDFGIPAAARIKAAEEALDFDGSSRIVGGSPAVLGQYPHMGGLLVLLTSGRISLCGCALLSNTRILTAAHCWRTNVMQGRELTAVFGSTLLFSGGTRVTSTSVQLHPEFSPTFLRNDIAISVVDWVEYNQYIKNIQLPYNDANNDFVGYWANAVGFGFMRDNDVIGDDQFLSHISLQVIPTSVCQEAYGTAILNSSLCVGSTPGHSTCPGDSGGPLSIGSGDNQILIGIKSFSFFQSCERGMPIGFMRITSFLPWIQERL